MLSFSICSSMLVLKCVSAYIYLQLMKLLLISHNMCHYSQNPIYLKYVYSFKSNQIRFGNLKSSLLFKRFIVRLLTTLNLRKLKVR